MRQSSGFIHGILKIMTRILHSTNNYYLPGYYDFLSAFSTILASKNARISASVTSLSCSANGRRWLINWSLKYHQYPQKYINTQGTNRISLNAWMLLIVCSLGRRCNARKPSSSRESPRGDNIVSSRSQEKIAR